MKRKKNRDEKVIRKCRKNTPILENRMQGGLIVLIRITNDFFIICLTYKKKD